MICCPLCTIITLHNNIFDQCCLKGTIIMGESVDTTITNRNNFTINLADVSKFTVTAQDGKEYTVNLNDSQQFTINIQDCKQFTVNIQDCAEYTINDNVKKSDQVININTPGTTGEACLTEAYQESKQSEHPVGV